MLQNQFSPDFTVEIFDSFDSICTECLDVASDFAVEGGITYKFIKQHFMTRCENRNVQEAGTATESPLDFS